MQVQCQLVNPAILCHAPGATKQTCNCTTGPAESPVVQEEAVSAGLEDAAAPAQDIKTQHRFSHGCRAHCTRVLVSFSPQKNLIPPLLKAQSC